MHAPLAPPLSSKRGNTNFDNALSQELVECTYICIYFQGITSRCCNLATGALPDFQLADNFTLIRFNKKIKIQYALIGAVLSDKSFLQR
jgi:hypothetical protein